MPPSPGESPTRTPEPGIPKTLQPWIPTIPGSAGLRPPHLHRGCAQDFLIFNEDPYFRTVNSDPVLTSSQMRNQPTYTPLFL